MENQENSPFQYTYSAKEQAEIKRIREKYLPREENTQDKMAQLRKLDKGVEKKATAVSLIFGVTGALVLGTGMSLILTDLGIVLGMSAVIFWLLGILLGLCGLGLAGLAYPAYRRITRRERERLAPKILQLTEELLK